MNNYHKNLMDGIIANSPDLREADRKASAAKRHRANDRPVITNETDLAAELAKLGAKALADVIVSALAVAGSQREWDSETIEQVTEVLYHPQYQVGRDGFPGMDDTVFWLEQADTQGVETGEERCEWCHRWEIACNEDPCPGEPEAEDCEHDMDDTVFWLEQADKQGVETGVDRDRPPGGWTERYEAVLTWGKDGRSVTNDVQKALSVAEGVDGRVAVKTIWESPWEEA